MNEFSLLDGEIAGVRMGQGRPVLAFHGFLDNAMSFQSLSESLLDVELWCIDLPGHGLSRELPRNDGTFILSWLPTLGRVMDELGWSEYTILGHSLGAVVSQLLAAVDGRVSRLISLDALGPLTSDFEENFGRYQRLYEGRNKRFPMRYYQNYSDIIQSRLKGPFPLSEAASTVMAKRAIGLGQDGYFHRYDRQLRQDSLWRLSEVEVLEWLSRIECPVDLAVFNVDQWASYQVVFDQRKLALRNITLTDMPGSHHLHMECPDEVGQWVQAILHHN